MGGPVGDLALQEVTSQANAFGVVFHRDLIREFLNFGSGVVEESPTAIGQEGGGRFGEDDPELLAHLGERPADRLLVWERPVVAAGLGRAGPDDPEAGDRVGEVDPDLRELFVVPKEDIPLRSPAFDELSFEEQGLRFGADLVPLEVPDPFHHGGDLGGQPAGSDEIGVQASAEVLRLTYIDHQPGSVLHEVHPGGAGGASRLRFGRKFFPVGLHS